LLQLLLTFLLLLLLPLLLLLLPLLLPPLPRTPGRRGSTTWWPWNF
jgi:hypothetical protein